MTGEGGSRNPNDSRGASADSGAAALDKQGRELHHRLVEGDPTAQSQIAETFLAPVRRILASRFSDVQREHPDWIDDATVDAIMAYVRKPSSYDPSKIPLLGFLAMAARADLLTRLRKEFGRTVPREETQRRRIRLIGGNEGDDESVGNDLEDQNTDVAGEVVGALADGEFIEWLRGHISEPGDWAVVELLVQGDTGTDAYIEALGLEPRGMEPQALARRAYDHKERVKKRIRRLVQARREGREVRRYNRRDLPPSEPTS